MNRLPFPLEFFAHEREVWFRDEQAEITRLTQGHTEIVRAVAEHIEEFYPKAYAALCEEYKGWRGNPLHFMFRIVCRFIRCNFAQLDNIPDISTDSHCNFEFVSCPLRGECRHDRIICRPKFNHHLSSAELTVMRLFFDGLSKEAIGERLCLSPHTVHSHIRNSYLKLGVHSRAEFMAYAVKSSMFHEQI